MRPSRCRRPLRRMAPPARQHADAPAPPRPALRRRREGAFPIRKRSASAGGGPPRPLLPRRRLQQQQRRRRPPRDANAARAAAAPRTAPPSCVAALQRRCGAAASTRERERGSFLNATGVGGVRACSRTLPHARAHAQAAPTRRRGRDEARCSVVSQARSMGTTHACLFSFRARRRRRRAVIGRARALRRSTRRRPPEAGSATAALRLQPPRHRLRRCLHRRQRRSTRRAARIGAGTGGAPPHRCPRPAAGPLRSAAGRRAFCTTRVSERTPSHAHSQCCHARVSSTHLARAAQIATSRAGGCAGAMQEVRSAKRT
jgi:hypothetical protein